MKRRRFDDVTLHDGKVIRTCYECESPKELDEFFHKDKRSLRGRSNICSDCNIKKSKEYYKEKTKYVTARINGWKDKNKDLVTSYHRENARRNRFKISAKNKANPPKERMRKQFPKTPTYIKARSQLNNAVRAGKIDKPDYCHVCNRPVESPRGIVGHMKNIRKPLDVIWMCRFCKCELIAKDNDENRNKTKGSK